MPVVAGVLLDHVKEYPAQGDRASPGVAALDDEMWSLDDERFREGDFCAPGRPGLRDDPGLGPGTVEVTAGNVRGGEAQFHVVPGEHGPEPAAFHVGEVPDEAERERRDGPR